MPWWGSGGRPKNKLSSEYMASLCVDVIKYSESPGSVKDDTFVEAVRQMAEILVWDDQQEESNIFDTFLEKNVLPHITELLCKNIPGEIKVQLLQTLYIMVQNIKSPVSIFYLLSGNHIDKLIMYDGFEFEGDDELLSCFINFLKSLSLRLDAGTIQCFYNRDTDSFPLYTATEKFLTSKDPLTRAAARAIVVHICNVEDTYVLNHVIETSGYMGKVFKSLKDNIHLLETHLTGYEEAVNFLILPESFPAPQPPPVSLSVIAELMDDIVDELHYLNDMTSIQKPQLLSKLYTEALRLAASLHSAIKGQKPIHIPRSLACICASHWLSISRDPRFTKLIIATLSGFSPQFSIKVPVLPPKPPPKHFNTSVDDACIDDPTDPSATPTEAQVELVSTDGDEGATPKIEPLPLAVTNQEPARTEDCAEEGSAGPPEAPEVPAEVVPETKEEAEPEPGTEPNAEDSEPKGEPEAAVKPEAEEETMPETEEVARPETEEATKPELEQEAQPESVAEAEPNAEGVAEAKPEPEGTAEVVPEAEGVEAEGVTAATEAPVEPVEPEAPAPAASKDGDEGSDGPFPENVTDAPWLADAIASIEDDPRTPYAAVALASTFVDCPPGRVEMSGLLPARQREPVASGPELVTAFPQKEEAETEAAPEQQDTSDAPTLPIFLVGEAPEVTETPKLDEGEPTEAYADSVVGQLLLWLCKCTRNLGKYGRLDSIELCCRTLAKLVGTDDSVKLTERHCKLLVDAYRTSCCVLRGRVDHIRKEITERRVATPQGVPVPPPSLIASPQKAGTDGSPQSASPVAHNPDPQSVADPLEVLFLMLSAQVPLFTTLTKARTKDLATHSSTSIPLLPFTHPTELMGVPLPPGSPIACSEASPSSSPAAFRTLNGSMASMPGSIDASSLPEPGTFRVTGKSGAMVRREESLQSKLLTRLRQHTIVEVVEIKQRRCRIAKPIEGWISIWNSVGEIILQRVEDPSQPPSARASYDDTSRPLVVFSKLPLEKRCPMTDDELAVIESVSFLILRRMVYKLTNRTDDISEHLKLPTGSHYVKNLGEVIDRDSIPDPVRCQPCPQPRPMNRETPYTSPDFFTSMGPVLFLGITDDELVFTQALPAHLQQPNMVRVVAAFPLFMTYTQVDTRLNYRMNLKCKSFTCTLTFTKAPVCQQVSNKINGLCRAMRHSKTYTMCRALEDPLLVI